MTLTYARSIPPNTPQLEAISLTNKPADGSYEVTLDVVASLNSGQVLPVGHVPLSFTGQTLEFPEPFLEGFRKCLEQFVGTRWAKSKRFLPGDPGPVERLKRYERVAEELDRLHAVGAFERTTVERAKQVIAGKLQVRPPG